MKLLLTIAAGVGIYYFLGTDKGKDMVQQAKKAACDLKDDLLKKGKDVVSSVKEHTEMA
jgi:predicted  nucleic acid-binding Zn ribbon protein